jgi:large conductance mechanosensitive channel
MVDMAIGIISAIVRPLVGDIIMPLMGVVTGGVDFSSLFIALNGEHYDSLAQQAGAPTVNFGVFINNIISFMIARQGGSLAPRRPAQPRGYPLRARQPGG